MKATITLAAGFLIQAPPQSDKQLSVMFPTFGPFPKWGIETEELEAGTCGEVFNAGGNWQVVFLTLDGNAILKWDYNAVSTTLNNELHFCNLPKCPPVDGPSYIIPLPVCDQQHVQVCAGDGCGVQYELGHFGQSTPVQG